MSSSMMIVAGNVGVLDNLTRYFPPVGTLVALTTEAIAELPIRDAGVFDKLYAYVITNQVAANCVLTLRKNQAATSVTVTYAASGSDGETGFKEDTTNSVTVAATDEFDYQLVTGSEAGNNTITFTAIKVEFAPTSTGDCVTVLGISGVLLTIAPGQDEVDYWPPAGDVQFRTQEASVKYRARFAFTSSDFYTYVTANSRTSNIVFGTRKNGATGGQSVTYTSGQTGAKEDASGTDSLAVGDDFNYYGSFAGTAANTSIRCMSSTCISPAGYFPMMTTVGASFLVLVNSTHYMAVCGPLLNTNGEAECQVFPRFTFTASELAAYVESTSQVLGTTTFTLMDNGAASGIAVSYTTDTGLKVDTTNTATITTGTDEVDFRYVCTDLVGSPILSWIGVLGFTAVPVVNRVHEYNDYGRLNVEEPAAVAYGSF